MCAIIGWSGKLPTGLLYQLLYAAEHRGKDSTGVAYWDEELGQNFVVKHAVAPSAFVKVDAEHVNTAQRSARGIAHTRRASPKMPINNDNAHPFMYESFVFAHNGAIRNWKTLKAGALETVDKSSMSATTKKAKTEYLNRITTDSMILGPAIEMRDFSTVIGCMGLVWLYGENLYGFRSKKELTSAQVIWEDRAGKSHNLTLVASTWQIITDSLDRVDGIKYDAVESLMTENVLYEITPTATKDCGAVPVNVANDTDKFTSTAVDQIQLPL